MHNWLVANGVGTGGASISTIDLTLTATTNITSPIATLTPGMILAVRLTQDATGGHTITWDTIFRFPPAGLGTLAHTISTMIFVSFTDPVDSVVRWWLMAVPVSNKL
jgi:hypothetical protein